MATGDRSCHNKKPSDRMRLPLGAVGKPCKQQETEVFTYSTSDSAIVKLLAEENGPTVVGDEKSDPELMEKLEATLQQTAGNNFKEWVVNQPPRIVLNRLEALGYDLVGTTGIGQTAIWTLHKPMQ